MNKKEAYSAGFESGFNTASWIDVPELGTKIPKDVDYVGYDTVSKENFLDVMEMYASESESNSRQFSPFEFTANEINSSRNPDGLWNEYDRGVSDGIRKNLKNRKLSNYYK